MKLGKKITVSFGAMVTLTLLLGVLTYWGSAPASHTFEQTQRIYLPTVLLANRAQIHLLQMLSGVRGYLALGSSNYQQELSEAESAFRQQLQNLQDLAHNGENQRRLEELEQNFDAWLAYTPELFSLRNNRLEREPAFRMLNLEAEPIIMSINRAITNTLALQSRRPLDAEALAFITSINTFQNVFFNIVTNLRSYIITSEVTYQRRYVSIQRQSDLALTQLLQNAEGIDEVYYQSMLTVAHLHSQLHNLAEEMFAMVESDAARQDLYLFTQDVVPLAERMLELLGNLNDEQQDILQAEINRGIVSLERARVQNLLGGIAAVLLGLLLAWRVRRSVVVPVGQLTEAALRIQEGDLSSQAPVASKDEIGTLALAFNSMTQKLRRSLNDLETQKRALQAANIRMEAELNVVRRLQEILQPSPEELQQIPQLDIAAHMEAASEVGGDYYDVLEYDGKVKIGIGDVTGHGLESGVVMLMTQAAVRTLLTSQQDSPREFLHILNRTVYDNLQRMNANRSLTLSLLDYTPAIFPEGRAASLPSYHAPKHLAPARLTLSGQHEHMIVVRQDGSAEIIDTIDLGFPLGLSRDIRHFVREHCIELLSGDGVILYTDGITEAENRKGEYYGLERLCHVAQTMWEHPAQVISNAIIHDLNQHIGQHKVYDDITLVVLKQR